MRISDWSSDVCSSDLMSRDRIVGPLASIRETLPPSDWLACTVPVAPNVPGPDRVRVLPDCISTIRSPATRVSLSLDLSRAPVGYLAADGPVERTTIDCAAAAVTMVRARSEEQTAELTSLMRSS